jgi:hypothetical protein
MDPLAQHIQEIHVTLGASVTFDNGTEYREFSDAIPLADRA